MLSGPLDDDASNASRKHSQSLTPAATETAALAGAIERWAGDLALGEEPARFQRALEDGAP